MPKTYILICRQEDDSDVLTELERLAVPEAPSAEEAGTALIEHLENQAIDVGHQVAKKLIGCQWQHVEKRLIDEYQALFPPRKPQA